MQVGDSLFLDGGAGKCRNGDRNVLDVFRALLGRYDDSLDSPGLLRECGVDSADGQNDWRQCSDNGRYAQGLRKTAHRSLPDRCFPAAPLAISSRETLFLSLINIY